MNRPRPGVHGSALDQRVLLHTVADSLQHIADGLPLDDQVHPDPPVSLTLEDEMRRLARLLGYLAGATSTRHRDAADHPGDVTDTDRTVTIALAQAAESAGHALASLGTAVRHLARLTDLTRRRAPATTVDTALRQTVLGIRTSRRHLHHGARQLRTTADARAASAIPAPPPQPVPLPRRL
ncbi:hypothetical protein [Streptomyces acidiscabies]|uniref:Uncharacterized protein n=1 Tax=Streptomyces acidiscabies TaxID=42234 RepID=A0AAP6BJ05_9ACTN|nr:hypothetical protein [Streptomyces acidiscabies]MBP5935420.1 hypothetical protein [Streptomyces sp. LBUM 1476]MBZ3916725.1 hypothetical protein [Streptomyces acidiscabies]MDX2965638.1 hypothetical protein [Streptomyces acidiscabies]MDX3024860.1 hypothetical protein [Streptomyces acidiscabies]MDX3795554.1 hypothetical protein [Streptomyces acidiscabies]